MKNQPQRTCMGCNSKKDKRDLIRIVKNKENQNMRGLTRSQKILGRVPISRVCGFWNKFLSDSRRKFADVLA